MSEVSFAKSFLASLDSKPIKLPADTVFDPKTFAPRFPITLPRLSDPPHPPMPKKVKTAAPPGSSKGITVQLKSARNPVLDIKLGNVAIATATIQELKDAVHQRIRPTNAANPDERVPLDKIKLLWKRKPVQGTLADVLTDESDIINGKSNAEFSVMVLGGASVIPEEELKAAPAPVIPPVTTQPAVPKASAQDSQPSTKANISSEFWEELEVFLQVKLEDKTEAAKMRSLFEGAWKSNNS